MKEQENVDDIKFLSITGLAFERTLLAYERTLMAWIRTAVLLISLGFSLYKFFEEVYNASEGRKGLLAPRLAGMIFIAVGLLALCLAQIRFHKAAGRIRETFPDVPKSVSSLISILVLVFGLILFLGALFKQ